MGLHNKFPSYFYKRGNLFNTYLGHTEQPEAPPQTKRPADPPPRKPKPGDQRPSREPPVKDGRIAKQLGLFAKEHMSPAETIRFLELVAADCGVSLPPGQNQWQPWSRVEAFAFAHLSPERTLRFLSELEQRRSDGRALIRPELGLPSPPMKGHHSQVFPLEDVLASRADQQLQREHAAEVAETRRAQEGSTVCDECGTPGPELAWFYFSSPLWTWRDHCGRAGVIAFCDRGQASVASFVSVIN
jgi:hypothetical protein